MVGVSWDGEPTDSRAGCRGAVDRDPDAQAEGADETEAPDVPAAESAAGAPVVLEVLAVEEPSATDSAAMGRTVGGRAAAGGRTAGRTLGFIAGAGGAGRALCGAGVGDSVCCDPAEIPPAVAEAEEAAAAAGLATGVAVATGVAMGGARCAAAGAAREPAAAPAAFGAETASWRAAPAAPLGAGDAVAAAARTCAAGDVAAEVVATGDVAAEVVATGDVAAEVVATGDVAAEVVATGDAAAWTCLGEAAAR